MASKSRSKQRNWRTGFVVLMAIFSLWIASQAAAPVDAFEVLDGDSAHAVVEVTAVGRELAPEAVATSTLAQPAAAEKEDETEGERDWFIVDEESQWTAQETIVVEQIMAHSWQALDSVGLDGQDLLKGYRFRRAAGEYVPGQERTLAMVDHQQREITLADGAFKRLHGFYIYHELGHAVDRQLERLPSEIYHRIAGQGQEEVAETGDGWTTTTGFWLRYPGRDDREEATADAFAWWVMAQAGQPKPFFPGTPVTTDYDQVARTVEEALGEAVVINWQPA